MDFENNVPEWRAAGTEPPESLKESGFQAGYKPPAAFFNWFWNRVSLCLKEIREKLAGHAVNKENPHGVTAEQIGLGNVNNTADSEKAVKFAQEAGVARKAEYAMTIRLNGGRTESTDQFTYNGSTSRTVNITPEKIGAAEKDLSNVDGTALLDAATEAGVGIPIAAATSADGVAYAATVKGVTELYNGLTITIIPNVVSTSTAITLDVNGLGAKMVRLPLSFNNAAMSIPKNDSYFTAGRPIMLQYDAGYLNGDGIWKTVGKQKTSAQDLYGTVPIESGGTGATTAAEALKNLGGVTSVNGKTGDVGPLATIGVSDSGNANERYTVKHPNADIAFVFNKDGKMRVWDGTKFIAVAYSDVSRPPASKIATGGTEGQLCAVNADGTISPNARTIASLGTGATYKLEGTTLTITTIKE